jgi:hypothetical protein
MEQYAASAFCTFEVGDIAVLKTMKNDEIDKIRFIQEITENKKERKHDAWFEFHLRFRDIWVRYDELIGRIEKGQFIAKE